MTDPAEPAESKAFPDDFAPNRALFPGLVFNEAGEPAEVAYVGGVPHYAIPDDGFRRHVECWHVDRVVIASLKEMVTASQDQLVRAMLQMLGRDDLFTKAALDASIRNMEQGILHSDPDQWAPMLGMMGFRVIVDLHGNVLDIVYPQREAEDED